VRAKKRVRDQERAMKEKVEGRFYGCSSNLNPCAYYNKLNTFTLQDTNAEAQAIHNIDDKLKSQRRRYSKAFVTA
jgi:hypothetical protein